MLRLPINFLRTSPKKPRDRGIRECVPLSEDLIISDKKPRNIFIHTYKKPRNFVIRVCLSPQKTQKYRYTYTPGITDILFGCLFLLHNLCSCTTISFNQSIDCLIVQTIVVQTTIVQTIVVSTIVVSTIVVSTIVVSTISFASITSA